MKTTSESTARQIAAIEAEIAEIESEIAGQDYPPADEAHLWRAYDARMRELGAIRQSAETD